MIALELAALLIMWVALFGLLVVVPWGVIRIVGVPGAYVAAIPDRWTPSAPRREREQPDTTEVGVTHRENDD